MNKPLKTAGLDEEINTEILRQKYAAEREKRLNPRKNQQFVEVSGEFSRYVDDPYVEEALVRQPVERRVEVLIIGGGYGGQVAAATLLKSGIEDFCMIDKAGDFGGTWYWNRYPGAQCDIESYIYMPLLEETGYIPTEKYVHGPELLAYAQQIGKHFDLYRRALFETQVTALRWDESAGHWAVATDRGDKIQARYVLSVSGPLNRPRLPGIPGIPRFQGHTFHTSRWDYSYTGGNSNGGMIGLRDKRVAIIGTAATALQVIPFIAQDAKHLYVVQRTPSSISPRGNQPSDPQWAKALVPGWQKQRRENFDRLANGIAVEEDLVKDGWTDLFHEIFINAFPRDGSISDPAEMARLLELADLRKGNQIRAAVDEIVRESATAEALKPWYGTRCKRPNFSDNYLTTFNRPNVTLIDTDGRGLDSLTEHGMIANGVEYNVDCIVFATGFEVGTSYTRRSAFEVWGRDGVSMSTYCANGPRSLHGFHVHGFPNFFMIGLGQNAFKPNGLDMITEQCEHLVTLISETRAKGATRIEATREAEDIWLQTLLEKSQLIRHYLETCTPGMYNSEGDIDVGLAVAGYGGGSVEFSALLQAWRAAGDYPGLVIS